MALSTDYSDGLMLSLLHAYWYRNNETCMYVTWNMSIYVMNYVFQGAGARARSMTSASRTSSLMAVTVANVTWNRFDWA